MYIFLLQCLIYKASIKRTCLSFLQGICAVITLCSCIVFACFPFPHTYLSRNFLIFPIFSVSPFANQKAQQKQQQKEKQQQQEKERERERERKRHIYSGQRRKRKRKDADDEEALGEMGWAGEGRVRIGDRGGEVRGARLCLQSNKQHQFITHERKK